MNIEEKAKAYDEALEKAKKYMKDGYTVLMPDLFPELKETEDERMLREIKRYIKEQGNKPTGLPNGIAAVADMLAWLEKQKEPKWSPSKGEMGVLYKLCYISNQITDEDDTELTRLYQDLKREYFNGRSFENMFPSEKQKEQKSIESIAVEVTKDKESAIKFLKSAGIMDDNGELAEMYRSEPKPAENNTRTKIISRATSEKQVVLVSESSGNAEIGWDTRSLEDAKNLLEYGISFINKQLSVKPAEWSEEDEKTFWGLTAYIPNEELKRLGVTRLDILKKIKSLRPQSKVECSGGERIRKELILFLKEEIPQCSIKEHAAKLKEFVSYLEKQKEPNLSMIQWTGNNLKEVIEFTGKSDKFEKWFKSWDEYEAYVRDSGNILKLFCEGDDHYKVPVGAWIIKTPDGHNIPSCFEFVHNPDEIDENKIIKKHITEDVLSSEVNKRLKECGWYVTDEKPAEWSDEDEERIQSILFSIGYCKEEYLNKKDYSKDINWLKSLRPQPKKEWSKKDKKILQSLHHVMNCADAQNAVKRDGLSVEDVCNFLFSVEPNWKPSEEQMKHLERCFSHGHTSQLPNQHILESLYNELKKLM